MARSTNPPPLRVPRLLQQDKETAAQYQALLTVVRQLWSLAGSDVLLTDGTEGSPSLGFDGEAGLGIYRPEYGVFGIVAGGNDALWVSSDGIKVWALDPSAAIFNGADGYLDSVVLANGQILIGSTGVPPVAGTISGTANEISVAPGAGTLSIGISAAYAGQSSIDTLGTVTTGTWNADVIAAGYGGTGIASYAVGDILYASGTTALSKLAAVATGNVLRSGGVSTAPAWGKVDLTADVSGVLPIANGGGLSGVYTPTLTNVANIDASVAYTCQYMRVGDVVTVSGRVDIDATTVSVATQLGISLPIASNLTSSSECAGVAFCTSVASLGAGILSDSTNDRALLSYITTDTAARLFFFTFTYRVV